MAWHDIVCKSCNTKVEDQVLPSSFTKIIHLKKGGILQCGEFEIQYGLKSHRNATIREAERTVIYAHPKYGIKYPGRVDQPMPERYKKLGYERKEIGSVQEMHRFEKAYGVVNEQNHFDRGSGNDFLNHS